jgi:hypothetical protein
LKSQWHTTPSPGIFVRRFFLTREQGAQQLKEYITLPSVSSRNRQTLKRVKVLYLQWTMDARR